MWLGILGKVDEKFFIFLVREVEGLKDYWNFSTCVWKVLFVYYFEEIMVSEKSYSFLV